jgi:hypothetical protein
VDSLLDGEQKLKALILKNTHGDSNEPSQHAKPRPDFVLPSNLSHEEEIITKSYA